MVASWLSYVGGCQILCDTETFVLYAPCHTLCFLPHDKLLFCAGRFLLFLEEIQLRSVDLLCGLIT